MIGRVNKTGVTVLLVEKNVRQTLAIALAGYVQSQGRIVAAGLSADLRENHKCGQPILDASRKTEGERAWQQASTQSN